MKIHCSWSINKYLKLPFRKYWYTHPKFKLDDRCKTYIVIVDIALKAFSAKELNRLFAESGVQGVLVLINSYDASSIGMLEVNDKILKVNWSQILTFAPIEAEKYGRDYMGPCYYSMHTLKSIKETYSQIDTSDAYFTGGIKGGREELMLQNGSSLRYFEAVCYNRKLLTNNPNIEKLPFYNPEYMKVFSSSDDIDVEWVKKKGEIDYGYDGSFSPYYLLSKMR